MSHAAAAARRCRPWGFSLVEIALAVALLGGALALVAAVYNHVLTRARVTETRQLLAGLGRAAAALDEQTALRVLPSTDGQQVLDALCTDPAASIALRDVSPYLWRCTAATAVCADSWDNPLRVITRSTTDAVLDQRLQLAGGGAVFESAGPDGDFGDASPARRMDNLRSDDPDMALAE